MNKLKSLFALLLLSMMVVTGAMAQERMTVKGQVTDAASGEPLIAVVVKEKGATTNGVVTDFDGNYIISVSRGGTLSFSYVGYLTKDVTATTETMNIQMEQDNKVLDEVVVVGYGVQKKSSLTGSVSTVKQADLESRGVTNVMDALAGKVAGAQSFSSSAAPGKQSSVQIRGVGSNGSTGPLFVIDGRVASSPGNLDPNDIESVEVLKDASSAAIYGASAGNGVILITTKKGKGKGTISYEFQFSSQSLGHVPNVMNSEQFIDFYTEAGLITKSQVYNNWDFKQNTDWTDVAFENSQMMRHSLKFQGGNDKGNYYLSLNYLTNDGIVVGDKDKHERYSMVTNASYNIAKWLEVGTNNVIEYNNTHSIAEGGQGQNVIGSTLNLDPLTAPTYTRENMPANMLRILNDPANTYGPLLGDGRGNYYGVSPYMTNDIINPLIIRDHSDSETRILSITGTTFANVKPIKDLTFTSRLSYALSNTEVNARTYEYFGIFSAGNYQNYLGVSASNGNTLYWQWENFLNYLHTFGENHTLGVMLGTSYSENRTTGVNGSITGTSADNIGFLQNDPNFMYFAYATADATKTVSGGEPLYTRKLAYFGRVNYAYKDKYLLQASLRADAADLSILPSKKRWGYFPAASAGWVISSEKFMESTKSWLEHLKLRVSWGQNGSLASLGNYMYDVTIGNVGRYSYSNSGYTYAYAPSTLGNDELKWETSEQIDLGFDLRLFRNRLTFSADWYKKTTKDLLVIGAPISTIAGFAASPFNAGSIRNTGFEFDLGWQDNIKDFSYGIRMNLSTTKNKVEKISDNVQRINGTEPEPITMFEAGQPAWYFYGYKYLGADPQTGDPVFEDVSKDGIISEDDKTYIGKGIPDFSYGITLNAVWKGIDLLVFGRGVAGVDIFNRYENSTFATNRMTHFAQDRWTSSNPNGRYPRATSTVQKNFTKSDAYVFNGSFFKIKQIQLGYTLPKSLLKKTQIIEGLRVYGSLEDFFTFTSYPGYDPEIVGTGNAAGTDYGAFPTARKIILGVNVTF